MIHIDFIVDLPIDQNCATVLTIADYFLKMSVFVSLGFTTAEQMA